MLCLHVLVYHLTVRPEDARRGRWISWSWNYRQLWSIMWVLGTEPRPSDKTQRLLVSDPYLQLGLFFCLRGSHVAQPGLQLAMNLRMTLNFWFTCLHIPRSVISGIFHHVWFMGSLGTGPKALFIADNHLSDSFILSSLFAVYRVVLWDRISCSSAWLPIRYIVESDLEIWSSYPHLLSARFIYHHALH